jgi:hypothetical protein
MSWFGLSLLCADLGLILVLATSHSERLWRTYRRPALLAFQGGVLLASWVIVSYAAQSGQRRCSTRVRALGWAPPTPRCSASRSGR